MSRGLQTLVVWPSVGSGERLNDICSRLAWYFAPWGDAIQRIVIPVEPHLSECTLEVPEDFDPQIKPRLEALRGKMDIGPFDWDDVAAELLLETAILLRLDETATIDFRVESQLRSEHRMYDVDRERTRNEGSFFLWVGRNHFGSTKEATRRSYEGLQRFARTVRSDRVYIFGTGPSLGSLTDYSFGGGQAIAINSMVANTELLDKLDLVAIAAADPIFHAGCSRYAGKFRTDLIAALDRYEVSLFIPLRDYEQYLSFLPERHHARVIGLPFDGNRTYNLDIHSDFYVSPKPNILTLALFPIAATFFRDVVLAGCDGRPRIENRYFWKHDKKSQYDDLMESIRRVHPSFFAIDYDDYYESHVETTRMAIEAIESKGGSVRSLTPSHIDAIGSRFAGRREPILVCIDPDGVSEKGHFLNYDDRIVGEARRRGLETIVLGPADIELDAIATRPYIRATFSGRSWHLKGDTAAAPSLARLNSFQEELGVALEDVSALGRPILLYMYCGSLESALAVDAAIGAFPNCAACINLFYLSFVDVKAQAEHHTVRKALAEIRGAKRTILCSPTEELAEETSQYMGLSPVVLPHPSTTYDDTDQHLPVFIKSKGEFTVLFPGSGTMGKGWADTLAVLRLAKTERSPKYRWRIRLQPGSQNFQERRAELREFADFADVVDGNLDRAQFKAVIEASDIVVLPYDRHYFRNRTSGLLVDALYAGKPMVVLPGTWLANIVERHGFGVVSRSGTAADIIGAINQLSDDYEAVLSRLNVERPGFLAENSWKQLLDTLLVTGDAVLPAGDLAFPVAPETTKYRVDSLRSGLVRTAASDPSRVSLQSRLAARMKRPSLSRPRNLRKLLAFLTVAVAVAGAAIVAVIAGWPTGLRTMALGAVSAVFATAALFFARDYTRRVIARNIADAEQRLAAATARLRVDNERLRMRIDDLEKRIAAAKAN